MSHEGKNIDASGLIASADMSSDQFKFVKMTTTDSTVELCDIDGEVPLGVLQNDPSAAGQAAAVVCGGHVKVMAGETIVAKDLIGVDSAGKARKVEKTNTGADIGDVWVGQAITGGAVNEIISIWLTGAAGRVESA